MQDVFQSFATAYPNKYLTRGEFEMFFNTTCEMAGTKMKYRPYRFRRHFMSIAHSGEPGSFFLMSQKMMSRKDLEVYFIRVSNTRAHEDLPDLKEFK